MKRNQTSVYVEKETGTIVTNEGKKLTQTIRKKMGLVFIGFLMVFMFACPAQDEPSNECEGAKKALQAAIVAEKLACEINILEKDANKMKAKFNACQAAKAARLVAEGAVEILCQ